MMHWPCPSQVFIHYEKAIFYVNPHKGRSALKHLAPRAGCRCKADGQDMGPGGRWSVVHDQDGTTSEDGIRCETYSTKLKRLA
ncbi:hypothetical protein DPMN_067359 [Dreissena polymorpha]|uniref:Uncharacterized protein n=1 Tax=Dreissena polymorpha TaxID=45954 RepID=A0A9D3Z0M0_DREPO|nr:hypothetical protein DPMN_067359 [Dreissena polymorpha]